MAKFYFVHLKPKDNTPMATIEEAMNKSLDWYRIDPSTWIIYSSSDVEKIYARLSPLAKTGGNVFICELNPAARQGWMAKSFWAWLKKER